MKHRDFFQIVLDQHYFSANKADLILVPEETTLAFLKKHEIVVRTTAKGVKILEPIDEKGLPVLESKEVLRFTVFATSGNYSRIVEILEVNQDEVLFFSNKGLKNEEKQLTLSKTKSNQVWTRHKAVAIIAIALSQVHRNIDKRPPKYQVVFKPKPVKWKYYIVANAEKAKIEIKDRSGKLLFKELGNQQRNQDKIASALLLNFPDRQLHVFESTMPVDYQNTSVKNIQLYKNEHRIIHHLANPSMDAHGAQIIQIQ